MDQLQEADIGYLVDHRVPENEQIEYKRNLSATRKSAATDDEISDRAKEAICERVVAFANADGGALLLGVKESNTRPPVAESYPGIAAFRTIEEKLKNILLDCIEPQLSVEVASVPVNGDGKEKGVVVIRVAQSVHRPHATRLKNKFGFPIRRGDRIRSMSIRDVQEMAITSATLRTRYSQRHDDRERVFIEAFKRLYSPANAVGFCITGIPVVDNINLNPVYSHGKLLPSLDKPCVNVTYQDRTGADVLLTGISPEMQTSGEYQPWRWHPVLRGARAEQQVPSPKWGNAPAGRFAYQEITCDGVLEMAFLTAVQLRDHSDFSSLAVGIRDGMPLQMLAELAKWAGGIRERAGAPNAEYGIRMKFRIVGNAVNSVDRGHVCLDANRSERMNRSLPPCFHEPEQFVFPEYLFGPGGYESVESLLSQLDHDLWNFVGADISESQRNYSVQVTPSGANQNL